MAKVYNRIVNAVLVICTVAAVCCVRNGGTANVTAHECSILVGTGVLTILLVNAQRWLDRKK